MPMIDWTRPSKHASITPAATDCPNLMFGREKTSSGRLPDNFRFDDTYSCTRDDKAPMELGNVPLKSLSDNRRNLAHGKWTGETTNQQGEHWCAIHVTKQRGANVTCCTWACCVCLTELLLSERVCRWATASVRLHGVSVSLNDCMRMQKAYERQVTTSACSNESRRLQRF